MRMSGFGWARAVKAICFADDWNSFSTALVEPDFQNCGWVASPALSKTSSIARSWPMPGLSRSKFEPTRVYRAQDARDILAAGRIDADAITPQIDGKFMSAFIRAVKPVNAKSCCDPACCN